jgi:hypothetical protein
MGLFGVSEETKRMANLCHLLYSKVPEKELISNYGFNAEEIVEAKEKLLFFDDFAYCRGKVSKAFRKK